MHDHPRGTTEKHTRGDSAHAQFTRLFDGQIGQPHAGHPPHGNRSLD